MAIQTLVKDSLRGIKMATGALSLIWYDLYLMAFLAIPLILTIIADLSVYNFLLARADNSIITTLGLNQIFNEFLRGPQWLHMAIGVAFLFAKKVIGLAFMAALIVYSASELKGKAITFARSFARLKNHWYPLLGWAVIGTLENLFLQSIFNSEYQLSLRFLTIGLESIWYLATWLVLPLIILEYNTLLRAFISSMILVRQKLSLIIGGALWLLGLSVVPNVIVYLCARFVVDVPLSPSLIVIGLIVGLAFQQYILTAETLFKTMIYQSFHKE